MKIRLAIGLSALTIASIVFLLPGATLETYLEILVILMTVPLAAGVLIHVLLDYIS